MNDFTVLHFTNVALGLAVLALWSVIITGVVQDLRERKRRREVRDARAQMHLVPPPSKAA